MAGTRISLLATFLALVIMITSASGAQAAEKGFWGPSSVNGVSQFPTYKKLGVTLYQTTLYWSSIAPTKPAHPTNPKDPAYRWPTNLDGIIREAQHNHMRVLLMLVTSPPWANGGKGPEWAPSPTAYAQFAKAAALRYPAVRQWMIWGEPTKPINFQPLIPEVVGKPLTRQQAAAPERYARMLDAAYGALKSVRRSNVVIGGNTFTTGDVRPVNWVTHMRLPNGKRPRMDVYGHNPFSLRYPDLSNPPGVEEIVDFSDLGRFQKVVHKTFGRRVRLFLSEFTVPTEMDSEFNFYATQDAQVKFIDSAFRVAHQIKAYGLGWIHLYDSGPPATGLRGGLIDINGKHKLGFDAFRRGRL
jgi:hypothetical protein